MTGHRASNASEHQTGQSWTVSFSKSASGSAAAWNARGYWNRMPRAPGWNSTGVALDPAEDTDAMPQILGSSVSYRIAVGPQLGRKAFMIRTIRPLDRPDPGLERVAKANGFSLHAGVSCEGHQKEKRERLCRYIARAEPPMARAGHPGQTWQRRQVYL